MPSGSIRLDSYVTFVDERSRKVRNVQLVLPIDANIAEGRISILTPIGAALYGLAEGDCISWPDLDGNETTRRIRELPGGRDLPVVFLTAKAMPGDREASLAAGATEYVTKPVDLDELLTIMARWVTPPRRPRRGAR